MVGPITYARLLLIDSIAADGIEDNPRPEELLNRLTNWFGEQFGRMFKAPNPGNLLCHGLQNDFYNCGLVAINAIEHELWQRELWTMGTKVQHRARWFNELSQAFFKQVRLSNYTQRFSLITTLFRLVKHPQWIFTQSA